MPRDDAEPTSFQVEVATLFFALPESNGFLLAGGAALLALGLTDRPTDDLDLFAFEASVPAARDALEAACAACGWSVRRLRDAETFVRLEIVGDDELRVDLCRDSPPSRPSSISVLGPTFAPEDLAGRKVPALFSRAEFRDFADAFALGRRFTRTELVELAAEMDEGFDRTVFVEMISSHRRFDDDRLAEGGDDPTEVRRFFDDWAAELGGDR